MWHEDLIKKLCNYHLRKMWIEANKIKKNRAKNMEFANCPVYLTYILNLLYTEGVSRDINFRPPPDVWSVSDTPASDLVKELRNYVPWQTKEQQIVLLKQKGCCKL